MAGLPELETTRLLLRPLREGDKQFLASLDSDPMVMRYVHDGAMPQQEAFDFAELLIEMAPTRRSWGRWMVELREPPTPVGWVELSKLWGPDRDDLQLGYQFAPAHWGNGYATGAAARVVRHGFEHLGLDRVMAVVRPENVASVRVLAKAGFQRFGTRGEQGKNACDLYRLTAEEWLEFRR